MLSVVGIAAATAVIKIPYVVTNLIYRTVIVTKTPGVDFSLSIHHVRLTHELVTHGIEPPSAR